MIYHFQRILSGRLLAWSAVSILTGLALWIGGTAFWDGFAIQAMLWGAIDALIALFGLRGVTERINAPLDEAKANQASGFLKRVLWINTGLDVLYVAGGITLILTLGQQDVYLRGTGWGILVQGLFLFLFDLYHALHVPSELYLQDWRLFEAPEHHPFDAAGPRGTVVMVHGFLGTPGELRPLAEALNRAGWRTRGLLLQGHGPDLPALFQIRAKSWAQAVANEVHQARSEGLPVMLLGFSLGGGLAVTAASLSNPDKLVLLAPLYWEETWPLTLAGGALSVFLPHTFAPFGSRFIPLESFREPIRQISPDVQFDDPQVQASIRRQRLPMLLFEQVNLAVRLARDSAASIRMPVLVIQGKQDPIIRPERTQQLVKRLGPNVDYVEIPGEHQIVQPDGPGFTELVERVERFLAQ